MSGAWFYGLPRSKGVKYHLKEHKPHFLFKNQHYLRTYHSTITQLKHHTYIYINTVYMNINTMCKTQMHVNTCCSFSSPSNISIIYAQKWPNWLSTIDKADLHHLFWVNFIIIGANFTSKRLTRSYGSFLVFISLGKMKRRVDLFLGGKPLTKRHVMFLIVFVLNNLGQKLTKLAVGSVGLGIFT